jgi:hypothetical protein
MEKWRKLMKTIIRGILAAVFLVISLMLVQQVAFRLPEPTARLIEEYARLIEEYVRVPVQPRAVALALMALAGLLSDGLIFTLVPAAPSRGRRVLHALGMAGIFVLGFVMRETAAVQPMPASVFDLVRQVAARWPLIFTSERVAAVMDGWPLIVAGGVGLAGYLLVSPVSIGYPLGVDTSTARPLPARAVPVRLPRDLRHHLHDDEKPLCRIQQTRLKEPITPDNLVATDQRLIVHHPTNLGFNSIIENYNYIDIADVKIECGWLFCTVSMKKRFEEHNMVFEDMPKRGGEEFVRVVTEQIHKHQSSVLVGRPTPTRPAPIHSGPMRALQRRLAAGAISLPEFEALQRRLSE